MEDRSLPTLLLVLALGALAPIAGAQAPTDLLPLYGVDLSTFETGADAFPIGSEPSIDQVWSELGKAGFNVLRVVIDAGGAADPAAGIPDEIRRLGELCLWAEERGVSLIATLVDGTARGTFGSGSAESLGSVPGLLLAELESRGAIGAYRQIMLWQIGGEQYPLAVGQRRIAEGGDSLGEVATALRQGELEQLEPRGLDVGLEATPLMVVLSHDTPVARAGAVGSDPLAEHVWEASLEVVAAAVRGIVQVPEVDVVGLAYHPGSIGAGGVDRLAALVRAVEGDLDGAQILLTTGYSATTESLGEQQTFYQLALANLADLRAASSSGSPFLGVVFRRALGVVEEEGSQRARGPQRTLRLEADDDDTDTWGGEWLEAVERGFGLLSWEGGALDSTPALRQLQELHAWMGEEQSPSSPSSGSHAESAGDPRVSDALGGFLDRLLQHLSDRLVEELGGEVASPGSQSPAASAPGELVIASATCSPAAPRVAEPVDCRITVANASATTEVGLVVALVDDEAYLLGEEAIAEGVAIPAGASAEVMVAWTPSASGPLQVLAHLYDAGFRELARFSLGTVEIGEQASGAGGTAASVEIASVGWAPEIARVAQTVTCSVILSNTAAGPARGLAVALLDSEGYLLAEDSLIEGLDLEAGVSRSVDLLFQPLVAGEQSLRLAVYDEDFVELTAQDLGPLEVLANGSGGGGRAVASRAPENRGLRPLDLNRLQRAQVDHRVSRRPQLVRIGYPTVGVLTATPSSAGEVYRLPLSNPSDRVLRDFEAELVFDGAVVARRSVGPLLPQQTRTVVFPGLPGVGEGPATTVTVDLVGAGSRPATVVRTTRAAARLQSASRGSAPSTATSTAASRVSVHRPELRKSVPAGTPSSSLSSSSASTRRLTVRSPTTTIETRPSPGRSVGARPSSRPVSAPPPPEAISSASSSSSSRPTLRRSASAAPPSRVQSRASTAPGGASRRPLERVERPDLALHAQSLSLQPAPRADQQVTVSATVRNLGPGAARQVEVHFRILSPSGQQLARGVERLPRIESRQSAVVRWSLRMPAGNRWRLEVAAVTPGDLDTGNDRAATTLSAPPTRLLRPRARPN